MPHLKPAPLRKGDLIGVISPASPVSDVAKLQRGVRYLETIGYRVVVGDHATEARGYLAGTDEQRVADLHAMFRNPAVRAIMCLRGGYGSPRLLPLINYKLIARNPKVVIGYSDITALQLALWKMCGLVTFHGPMLGPDFSGEVDPFTEEWFWRAVTSRKKLGRLPLEGCPVLTLRGGRGGGRLLGGNLSLVASLLGTKYLPDFRKSVLFLEETDEEPYRVDRMMTHLSQASILSKATAILAGQFTGCTPRDPLKPSFAVDDILRAVSDGAGLPFLANLPFGHIARKLTLPLGTTVRVDADEARVEFLESATA